MESEQLRPTNARVSIDQPSPAIFERWEPRRSRSSDHASVEGRYRRFRELCDLIVEEVRRADDYMDAEVLRDEGLEVVVEVLALLEQLYDCGWGEGENLKAVVVAVQSQVNNAIWKQPHLAFLQEFMPYLRVRYVVDETAVDECYATIERHGLDPFRGTISLDGALKKYRIEEVREA